MTAYSKQLIIFDLDGTLALSKTAIKPDMALILVKLLERKKVAIMSGGGFAQFETQVIHSLPSTCENFSNLIILPTCGAQMYVWKGTWKQVYAELLSADEKSKIMSNIRIATEHEFLEKSDKIFGPTTEDRGSQITYSALGQQAPYEIKKGWDPQHTKIKSLVDFLQPRLPEFDVRSGGTTSIDITRKGVNKSYGIRKLEEYLKMPFENIVFVGDALYPGGNDYPAKATGVDCISVQNPDETLALISSWV